MQNRKPYADRAPFLALQLGFVIAAMLLGCWLLFRAAMVQAKWDPRNKLALYVAVVAVHEGAFENLKDTALIWQVTENRGSTTQERIDFLEAHSPRALGFRPCDSQKNCMWTPDLRNAPSQPPKMFDPKWWNAVRAERWRKVRRYALELVYGIETWRPCFGKPYSWGYAGDVEGAYRERKLVPMGCQGVKQDGFTPVPKVLRAAVAKGRGR